MLIISTKVSGILLKRVTLWKQTLTTEYNDVKFSVAEWLVFVGDARSKAAQLP